MNKRFGGDAWCKGWQREKRPVGQKCLKCECFIMKDDDGYIVAHTPDQGRTVEWRPMHKLCMEEMLGHPIGDARRAQPPNGAPSGSAYRGMGKR